VKKGMQTGMAVALALALSTGACSDSTGVSSLDQAAAMELAAEMGFGLIFMGMEFWGSGSGASMAAASTVLANTATFSETVPCDAGGTTAVQGSWTDGLNEEGTGTFSFSSTQTPSNCGMNTSQGVFTVNGNPNLSASATATVQEWDLMTMVMSMGGGFTWSGQGGSGSCNINIDYSFNFQTFSLTMTGSVCGHSVTATS
jgi:hypothetical protein